MQSCRGKLKRAGCHENCGGTLKGEGCHEKLKVPRRVGEGCHGKLKGEGAVAVES
jgi:hypothetical protein